MTEVRDEHGGWRRYVDGEPVHCGSMLELQVDEDRWEPVIYEHSGQGREWLYLARTCRVQICEGTSLRWPGGRA